MSTPTLIDDGPTYVATPHQGHSAVHAESRPTPPRPLPSSPRTSRSRKSIGNGRFGVAVVAVIAAFVASIVFLSAYEPGAAGVTTMSWPAAAAGMVALFSGVGGFVLAFIAAVRTDSV